MGLTRTAIQRPLATTMIFLALILLGQQAYTRMRVDRFPNITFPIVFVQIDWAGASPDSIEQTIIVPVENTLSGLSGVQRIDATALQGSARITIFFVDGIDINQAAIDTQRQLSVIGRTLPIDASQPSVVKADPAAIRARPGAGPSHRRRTPRIEPAGAALYRALDVCSSLAWAAATARLAWPLPARRARPWRRQAADRCMVGWHFRGERRDWPWPTAAIRP